MTIPNIRERALKGYEPMRFGKVKRGDAKGTWESESKKILNNETESILFLFLIFNYF